MIIADLKSLGLYKAMSENVKLAIEHLEGINPETIEDGKYSVKGDDVYVMVSTYHTREHSESKYEVHRNYIDIQYLLSGEEIIFCNEAGKMEKDGEYIPANDKLNFKDQQEEVSIHMKSGMAAVFYPNDAHKACCKLEGEPQVVRKLLMKVKI